MAGKKRKPGQKDARGGAREGAGRPKGEARVMSDALKGRILQAAEELAKERGITIEKAYLSMLYEKKVMDTAKASIFKTYVDALLVRESSQEVQVEKRELGPQIYLPKMDEDPALRVVKGGKGDS